MHARSGCACNTMKSAVLSRRAIGQTLMVNQLVDMKWKFGGRMDVMDVGIEAHMHCSTLQTVIQDGIVGLTRECANIMTYRFVEFVDILKVIVDRVW
uniref:Uncharacterized protein n=1 Tax=Gadus morhua TaxID=8049 RepID=A0A8C5B9D7_GADMO